MRANSFTYLAAVFCVATAISGTQSPSKGRYKASIFSDLSRGEMESVRSFLMEQEHLKLVSSTNSLSKNTIFTMELNIPKKRHVLGFLDRNAPQPPREARVIIFFADQVKPNITEYIVGPLPHPYYYKPHISRGNKTVRFEARPLTKTEANKINQKLTEVTKKFNHILMDVSGYTFYNCSDRCLTYSDNSPRGVKSGDRKSWFILQKFIDGYFLQPIGFEILLNHRSTNPELWTVEKLWYNGQYFDSVEEMVLKYERNEFAKIRLPDDEESERFSSYYPRGEYKTRSDINGPKVCEPEGKRYRVLGNYVEYAGWSFAFRIRLTAGLQIFDVQYNNERIAYEVSLQEAISFYSGSSAASLQTKYIDSGWGMGSSNYELAKGIDCPEVATYQDVYRFYDSERPVRYKNALCIFELPTGIPLRRHFDRDSQSGFNFYAGLENHVLVVRTISTIYNYDYIWDYVFYQNGVIEVKVSATGYIYATFFTPEGIEYGTRVHRNVLGILHTHLIHYKVDFDVAGTENSFETISLRYENISNPWSPGDYVVQSRKVHTLRRTERQAAFRFGKPFPKHLMFQNPNKMNKWGHPRSYRIQYNSHGDSVLPRGWKEEKGVSWSRYRLAVTRYSDAEMASSNIFIQCDPWDPVVYFENFLRNNDDIVNQDLVAWVTVGFLHIPQAEDIPNTATPGNSVGFFLRPFNFFDEDPSVASRSMVIVRPVDKMLKKVKIQRWTPEVLNFCTSDAPFQYNGTYLYD
ncbi:amiloride-sensitive amine oxidase [copper-containing] [Spea bombifrons]|uniref:amiloride-sensitive amine oxidase [copper-containing] n=1 Tax=Spea bombifrons TaxID=233779 RepID=UPI00234A297B|nr:amiloride-sensitive amine oxidase [copper-containing] [Spea bombifrons]